MSTVHVCFYQQRSLASWCVRLDTQRKHQPWADVPSHCAVVINDMLFEFVSTGWHVRAAVPSDFQHAFSLLLPNPEKAEAFAQSCYGSRYDWLVILRIALSKLIPDTWLSYGKTQDKHICSWFVLAVLRAGNWPEPHWLFNQYCPASPNDVQFSVEETCG